MTWDGIPGVENLRDCRSVAFWVCKVCGGFVGFRATTGEPGRLLEVRRCLIICVPTTSDGHAYAGACDCGDDTGGES